MNEKSIQPTDQQETMLAFVKAFANVDRLKIAGLLATEPANSAQIAARLNLPPYEVLRHLEQLEALGLIRTIQSGPATPGRETPPIYILAAEVVQQFSKQVLASSRPQTRLDDFDGEAFDRKVLKDSMTPDGRLKSIPNQEKKRLVILRHLVQVFQPGERYTERQVNDLLRRYNEDTAALRRYMVDNKLLARENAIYWRTS